MAARLRFPRWGDITKSPPSGFRRWPSSYTADSPIRRKMTTSEWFSIVTPTRFAFAASTAVVLAATDASV